MKAIITKYFGPTNSKGSRIKAMAEGVPAIYMPYDYSLSGEVLHRAAAEILANKYGWLHDGKVELIGGGLPDNTGYAFCFRFK